MTEAIKIIDDDVKPYLPKRLPIMKNAPVKSYNLHILSVPLFKPTLTVSSYYAKALITPFTNLSAVCDGDCVGFVRGNFWLLSA